MANYKLISVGKIDSTQTYAHDLIAHGNATNKTIIVADAQSAGRGRYRRPWISHHGNLYASFIYADEERDARLSYVVAIAVLDVLESLGINAKIKWPNDILIDDKKVAGILIEYYGRFVVVGIGINISTNPTVDNYKTTKINNYINTNRDDILNRLIKSMDKWMRADFNVIRSVWMENAIGINSVVKYQGMPAELIGINENGALVLRRDSKYFLVYGDEIIV